MVSYRYDGATSTLLADGRVLVTGGSDPDTLSSAEVYDPATGKWTKTGSMARAHSGQTATLLKDGRVLVVASCETHPTAELYDPATGKFSPAGKVAVDSTCASTATLLPDGRVLIAGGYGVSSASKLAELFDPATGKFTRTGSLHTARGNAQAALLPDGRVLVIGGDQEGGTPSEVDLDSAEIYDPATGKFSETGNMETPRTEFFATLLANGKVLVAGGASISAGVGVGFLDSAELYDPATGKFSPTGSMTFGRSSDLGQAHGTWSTMYTGLLTDGRVLIVGGNDMQSATDIATAETYDPATGKFSATTSPPQDPNPYGIPAVTLKDGRVLMPGAPSLLYTP
jgi:WD40 repeat protein